MTQFKYIVPDVVDGDHTSVVQKPEHADYNRQVHTALNRIGYHAVAYSNISDYALTQTPSDCVAGRTVMVYNFTGRQICMVDSVNSFTFVKPGPPPTGHSDMFYSNTIVIDVVETNQRSALSADECSYLQARAEALEGMVFTERSEYGYFDDPSRVTLTKQQKASCSRRYRYVITCANELLDSMNGAFYFHDADIVLGCTSDPSKIWLHPNSEPHVLAKVRPDIKAPSYGMDFYYVDSNNQFSHLFVNIAGKVIQVPIHRDPSQASGLYIWDNLHDKSSQMQFYEIDDPTCPIRLFTSVSAAEAGGDVAKSIDNQLTQRKVDLKERELDLALQKAQADSELYERRKEVEQEKINHEREQHKRELELLVAKQKAAEEQAQRDRDRLEELRREAELERQRRDEELQRKAKVEKVSFWRSIVVETTKALAAAATAVITVLALMAKAKAS